jgi:hypothetical protein
MELCMKKQILTGLSLMLLTSGIYANTATIAVTKNANSNNLIPLTLNNQAGFDITTDSNYVPSDAKVVAPFGAIEFEVSIPDEIGTKRIRYFNGSSGCDFYIDTMGGAMPGTTIVMITGVPVDSMSMCNVYSSSNVNHLAVSFVRA